MKSLQVAVLVGGWIVTTAFSLGGCASTYVSRPSKHISFALDSGHFVLHKEGRVYSAGGLSMEPVEAVRGNAVAEEYARTYVHRGRSFWALYGIGIGSIVAGGIVSPYPRGATRPVVTFRLRCPWEAWRSSPLLLCLWRRCPTTCMTP